MLGSFVLSYVANHVYACLNGSTFFTRGTRASKKGERGEKGKRIEKWKNFAPLPSYFPFSPPTPFLDVLVPMVYSCIGTVTAL